MKQAIKYVCGPIYKLRMMGITCEEPAFVYGDNKSMLSNTAVPASNSKKKTNILSYHFVLEGYAQDEWRTAYVNTKFNFFWFTYKTIAFRRETMGVCEKIFILDLIEIHSLWGVN